MSLRGCRPRAGSVVTTLLPRLTLALAFLYVGLYAVAFWHRLPLGALHRTILRGFTPCLVVFAVTWGRTGDETLLTAWINSLAFAGLLLALLRAAWRLDAPDAHPATVAWIWPWKSAR